jgi:hypothetical protein
MKADLKNGTIQRRELTAGDGSLVPPRRNAATLTPISKLDFLTANNEEEDASSSLFLLSGGWYPEITLH